MDTPTLVGGGIALLTGTAYTILAAYSWRRAVSPAYQTAWRLFQLWWLSIGANLMLTGVCTIAAGLGSRDLALFVTQAYLERLLLASGLAALLAYVSFTITGNRRTWIPIVVFYAAYYLVEVYQLARGRPVGIELHAWARPTLITSETGSPALQIAMLAMLLLPPIIASTMYFRLFFATRDPRQRVRIAVVSWGIIVWLILSVTAYLVKDSLLLQITNRSLSLGIALLILLVAAAPRRIAAMVDAGKQADSVQRLVEPQRAPRSP